MKMCAVRVYVVVSLVVANVSVCAQETWVSVKEKDGIEVFRRPYPGSDIQELQAVGKIRSELARLVRILSDVESQTKWIPLCVESRSLASAPADAKRIYRKFDNPWPFQDIDYVLDQTTTPVGAAGQVTIAFHEVKDVLAKQECCGRMQEFRGAWRLVPVADGFVEVTYTVHLVPEGSAPSAFLNASLGKIGWDTFRALERYASKPE